MECDPLVVQKGLDGLPQVFDEMKPVDHLHGLGGPLTDAIRVEGTPVTTDHRDCGMLREPGRYSRRRALGQHVQDPMIFKIDEDGPITLSPPPRPLIHAEDLRSGGHRHRGCLHQPEKGVGTGPPLAAGREPGACLATEGKAEGAEVLGEPQRPSRPWGGHGGQAFRKNLAMARGIVTEKLPHPQLEAYMIGAPRQIG